MKLNVPLKVELCYSLTTRKHITKILSRKMKILLHTTSISLWFDCSISCNEKQIKSCSFKKKKVSQTVTIYILYVCCRVSFPGDIPKVSGCGAGQLVLGSPAWAGRLDQMISRGPFQSQPFSDSLKHSLMDIRIRFCTIDTLIIFWTTWDYF